MSSYVRNEWQTLSPLLGGPTNPAVARSALPSGRSKEQASQIHSSATLNQITQVLSHRPAIAKVMVLGQIPLELTIVRQLRTHDLDLQRSQGGQVGDEGLGRR